MCLMNKTSSQSFSIEWLWAMLLKCLLFQSPIGPKGLKETGRWPTSNDHCCKLIAWHKWRHVHRWKQTNCGDLQTLHNLKTTKKGLCRFIFYFFSVTEFHISEVTHAAVTVTARHLCHCYSMYLVSWWAPHSPSSYSTISNANTPKKPPAADTWSLSLWLAFQLKL